MACCLCDEELPEGEGPGKNGGWGRGSSGGKEGKAERDGEKERDGDSEMHGVRGKKGRENGPCQRDAQVAVTSF